MTIQLIGELHTELKCLGLKEGDIIRNAEQVINSTTGLVHFTTQYCGFTINCSVWPANYKIVEP